MFLQIRAAPERGSLCNTDVLGLGEEAQGFFAAFAADAALFHAAKGNA